MKQRDITLDMLRIIACMMVVLMHSPIPSSNNANGLLLSSVSYFTAPCIGLFFMVSGALLLPPPPITSESEPALDFLRKRLKRVLKPTLAWTLFYLAVKLVDGNLTAFELLRSVFSMPFSAQGHGVLWFMYTLMGLYLVTPILHSWLRSAAERDIRFYLLLWLISMCYPVLGMFVNINDTPTGILYYFSGYVGYFLLGYWLQRYGDKLNLKIAALLMCISVAAPIVVKLMNWTIDFYAVFWYLSVFVAMQCVFWWKVLQRLQKMLRLSDGAKRMITIFSNLSFGIYLSHIFIMRRFVWNIPFVANIQSLLLQTVIVALLTFVLSLGITWVIASTPLGNAVIGWRNKR